VAYFGHWRLCEFLIEQGADVNRADPDTGETPLHAALCTPNRPAFDLVVRVLLAAGADPNRATKPGVETGAFTRDCRTKGETPLHRAAAFASEETIQLLLDAGAARDARDMSGDSPLGWASWHTCPDTILRKLCYGDFHIRSGRNSSFDHGRVGDSWTEICSALPWRPRRQTAERENVGISRCGCTRCRCDGPAFGAHRAGARALTLRGAERRGGESTGLTRRHNDCGEPVLMSTGLAMIRCTRPAAPTLCHHPTRSGPSCCARSLPAVAQGEGGAERQDVDMAGQIRRRRCSQRYC
jgi:hypothetical protein